MCAVIVPLQAALIGQSAMVYCASKIIEKSRAFWIESSDESLGRDETPRHTSHEI